MKKLEERFPGKRILITGATTGLGEALAYVLAARGWRIAISAREQDEVERTVAAVNQLGGKGLGLILDVVNMLHWAAARDTLNREWGGIDILVNNAGIADANPMIRMTEADWDRMLAINLRGVIDGCRTFVPDLIRQNAGYILNVASAAGLLALPEMSNYNVSKAGVIALSETLRAELCGANIGVTVLCPSGFRSSLIDNAAKEGRDVSQAGPVARLVKKDVEQGPYTSQSVAVHALKDMEKGRLYSLPMPLYRLAWFLKRLAPNTFYSTIGWAYRNKLGPFAN